MRFPSKAEFAQLLPGHPNSTAFDRTQRDLRNNGRDFQEDELNGISYLEDFEGFENTFSLSQPVGWRLSAPPELPIGIGDPAAITDSLTSNWRARFGWYIIPPNTLDESRTAAR